MTDKPRIEIRAVPKLGSTRETMQLVGRIIKEDMGFKKKLAGESRAIPKKGSQPERISLLSCEIP